MHEIDQVLVPDFRGADTVDNRVIYHLGDGSGSPPRPPTSRSSSRRAARMSETSRTPCTRSPTPGWPSRCRRRLFRLGGRSHIPNKVYKVTIAGLASSVSPALV